MPVNITIPNTFANRSGNQPAADLDENWDAIVTALNGLVPLATEAILQSLLTTKGDLVARGAAVAGRLPVGTNGQFLVADSAEALGVKWGAGASAIYTDELTGLGLSNNGTDATNDIDIAAGAAASDHATITDRVLMILASGLTKRLDAAWAVGTNQGGLDTGSIADTTYHVWLIRRSDTGVVDVLFSTSATSPTMPTNYDQKRRIGSILRESASIVGFVQDGDEFQRTTVPSVTVDNPGVSAALVTLPVPVGIKVEWIGHVGLYINNAGATVYVSDPAVTDQQPTMYNEAWAAPGFTLRNTAVNTVNAQLCRVRTNTSAQIRRRCDGTDGDTDLFFATRGWIDRRGRG